MKKLLGIILCVCMLVSMVSLTVSAVSQVNIFRITVTEPKVGEKPSNSGSVPDTASTSVTNVARYKEGLYGLSMPAALQTARDVREKELVTLFEHKRPKRLRLSPRSSAILRT